MPKCLKLQIGTSYEFGVRIKQIKVSHESEKGRNERRMCYGQLEYWQIAPRLESGQESSYFGNFAFSSQG
ncbi:unnamed protein product [Cylicocyclus nassatus]|uniref:Uncharacterized protein n=1 Tax=Cylicocyclus nassatus TaxID=53992 RepID=A0AA36GMT2_CYLNA|nr:unnamed protein product [Cylicocyclus nassatus]